MTHLHPAPLALALLLTAASVSGAAAGAPPQGGNPLARRPPDPFARSFAGGGLELALATAPSGGGYLGTLTVSGAELPVRARRSEGGLAGTFTADGEEYAFTCALDGDLLTLESDGERFELRARAAAAGGAGEPAKGPPPGSAGAALPELAGVYSGEVTALEHPDGYFRCDLPRGWSVTGQSDDGMLINPGLRETDTLDALLFVTYGELEERDRGLDVVQLLTQREADLIADLEGQGISLGKAAQAPRKVVVGDRAGAEQLWKGRAANGGLSVWCGALVEREYYLAVVAIVMEGKDAKYLPGAKRMFRSLQPKAPEPNPRLERALAGVRFARSESFGDSGAMHSTYTFGANGTVTRQTSLSGPVSGGDISGNSEDVGRYRAVGKLVYLQFRDGQEVARIEGPEDAPTGLRFGSAVYRRM